MLALLLRRKRRRPADFIPAVMVLGEDGVWYADTDPYAVAEAYWVDDGDGWYDLETEATEGYAVYVRRGRIYIEDGELIEVVPPGPEAGVFSIAFSVDFA